MCVLVVELVSSMCMCNIMYLRLSISNSLCLSLYSLSLCLSLSLSLSLSLFLSLSLSLTHKGREGMFKSYLHLPTVNTPLLVSMIVKCVYVCVWCGNYVYFGSISLSSLFQCSTIIKQYPSIVCVCVWMYTLLLLSVSLCASCV